MGCCISKRESSSSSPPPISLSNGGTCSAKASYLERAAVKSLKPEIEASPPKPEIKEDGPRNEKVPLEGEMLENGKTKKEVFVIKHRKSHERSNTTDPVGSQASATEERSVESNPNPAAVVRTSSCTKEEVDAILIQCGRLSRSNSNAAKTRRYSGSKRSFDFDRGGDAEEADADAEDVGGEDEERRIHRQRHRGSGSPRERRRRTPSREREDSKGNRSGSRDRATGASGGSRRVSRSPGRRSDKNSNPNPSSGGASGSSVNSGNNRPGKLVSVPATDKTSLAIDKSYNGEPSIKRITVKRNVGEVSRTAASPRSQSPARAAVGSSGQPTTGAPSLSRSSSRKAEHSPYRRNPLGEIDPNSLAYPSSSKEDKMGSSGNGSCNKKMMNRDNESQVLAKETGNYMGQKSNHGNTRIACRAASPSRAAKDRQEPAEECKITPFGAEPVKPQVVSRSRSLRRSRDFDFSPEAFNDDNNAAVPMASSYTALLLEDIQNFHQKSVNVNASSSFTLPPCVTKACSIVEAVADFNSTTNTSPLPDRHQRNEFKFAASASHKSDLMEPSFEKYVTVKRGGSLDDMDEQESSGSNSFTGSSGLLQRQGFSSSSWEPNSADSTDRWSSRSNNTTERDRSPFRVRKEQHVNIEKQEFDPLKKGIGGRRGVVDSSISSGKSVILQTTTRVAAAAASM